MMEEISEAEALSIQCEDEVDNFFNDPAPIQNKGVLDEHIKEYEALTLHDKLDWSNSDAFKEAVKYFEVMFNNNPPIKLIEDVVSHFKAKKQNLISKILPSTLHELGLNKVENDLYAIKLDNKISVSVSDKAALLKFLEENENGNEIKKTITFPKGAYNKEVEKYLKEKGYSFSISEDIHHKTLEKVMRLRLEQAEANKDKKEVTELETKLGKLPPESIATINNFEIATIRSKE